MKHEIGAAAILCSSSISMSSEEEFNLTHESNFLIKPLLNDAKKEIEFHSQIAKLKM